MAVEHFGDRAHRSNPFADFARWAFLAENPNKRAARSAMVLLIVLSIFALVYVVGFAGRS